MQLTQGSSRICGLRVRPNPLLKLSPNGVSPAFSPPWPWRHTVGASLARTLGCTNSLLPLPRSGALRVSWAFSSSQSAPRRSAEDRSRVPYSRSGANRVGTFPSCSAQPQWFMVT